MLKQRPELTVDEWLASVSADRRDAIDAVHAAVNARLPRGYEETVDAFAPAANRVTWSSTAMAIVGVDSLTGRVTGPQTGDAIVMPSPGATTGPQSVAVHVR